MKLLSCAFTFYCRAFYLGVVELSGIDFTATRLTSGMLEPVVYTIHQLRIILGPIITFVDKKLLGAASSSSSSSSPSKTSKQNVSTLALSLKNQYLELISDELNGFTSCRSVLSLCSLFLTVSELIGVSSDPVYQARLRFVTDLYICTLASIDGLSVQNRGFSSPVFSEFLSKRSYSDLTLLPLYDLEDGEELIDFLFDSTPFPEKPSALIKCSLEQQQQLEPLSFGKLFITQICSSASSLLSVSDDLLPAFLNLDSQTKEGPITPTVYDLLDSRFFLVLCCFVLNKSPDEFLFSNLIELFDENCQKRANLYRGFLLNLGNTLSSSSALEIKTTTLVSGFLSQDMKIKEVLLPELTANNYYNDLINDLKQTADASTQQFSSYDKLAPVKSPLLKEAFPALIEKFKPFEKDIDDKLKGAKMSFQPHHFHSPRPLDINITYDPSDYEHLESLREKEQKQRAAQTPREKALLLRKEQDREKAEIRYQDSLLHGQPITPKKIIVRNSGNSSHKEPKFEKQSIKAQKISQELEAASIKRIQAKYKEKLENLTSSLTSSQGNLSAVKSIEDLENECRREGCFEVAMSAGLKALEYHLCTIPPPTKKSNDSHSNKNNNSDGDGSDDEFLELDSLQSLAVYYIFSFTQKYTLDLIVENSSICKSLLAICKKYKLDDLVDNLKEQREKSEKNTKKALSSKSTKASVSSSTSSTSTSSTSLSSSTSSSSLSSSSSSSSSSVAPSKLVSDPDDFPCYPTFHSLFSQPIAEILPHKTSTRKDKRVEFPPDEWQIKLLDVVDKNESALIVAPTSSGKTFISYYCMEKILTQDNSSVVVYVAPTKALVNQVYSEVRARFQKTDSVVAGTFTRDFRYHQYRCQVLITVPQCLEILLLSPDKEAIAFSKKLAYVIFDEIHAVSSNTGAVWERLLVAINCPFLALSATIGQATEFHASLQRACSFKDKSSRVHLIEHKERFNDLSPLMLKSKEAPPNKFGVAENTLSTFHPLFAFQNKAMLLQNEQTLNNLAFVPEDSYKLYAACEQFCGTSAARSLSKPTRNALTELLKLEPCTYFSNDMSKWYVLYFASLEYFIYFLLIYLYLYIIFIYFIPLFIIFLDQSVS